MQFNSQRKLINKNIPFRELKYPDVVKKNDQLQHWLGREYVTFQEGISIKTTLKKPLDLSLEVNNNTKMSFLLDDGIPQGSFRNICKWLFKHVTPPKFNIDPEKCWLEDLAYFQGLCCISRE